FASLSALQTGFIFLLCGGMYAASSQVWGFICDRMKDPQKICIYGFVLSIVSFSLVGPIYGLPLKPSVPLAIVAQILFGVGMGGQIVSSFASGLKAVENSDLPKGVATSALVASVYASSFSLGTSIGPAVGGVLIDTIGYRVTCIPIVGIQLLMVM
ncbi:MFS-type transporter SLC18B1-like protein, partial [Leptotrombidium deliense]